MKRALLLLALVACTACDKVPITDIGAGFSLADATWFAQEQTLFVFYRVEAEQGLGPDSQVEVTYRTDDLELPWTALSELTPVHTHLPVDCGSRQRCGGISLGVQKVPRRVGVRLRYHRDGEMVLTGDTRLNVVGEGPAHTHRSLIVYGVFDATNTRVQWRARHQFPALRNEEVEELGLRRSLRVSDPRLGSLEEVPAGNPYGYGFAADCPAPGTPLDWEPVETTSRAVFDPHALELSASTIPLVCARATVTDALGEFEAVTLARKNPEVRPAFPALHSPIRANSHVSFLLRPCGRTISEIHREMQMQRLLMNEPVEVCTDDWSEPGFAASLAARVQARVDVVRALGNDMVITVVLHHDDRSGQLTAIVEAALEQVLPFERDKSSPRVSGAFVFDSFGYELTRPRLGRLALWCPALVEEFEMPEEPVDPGEGPVDGGEPPVPGNASAQSCPLMPDMPDIKLGPFRFSTLPILPTRRQYLSFVDRYSDGQAGKAVELRFLAPERTPLSENVDIGDFGVATFFNNETLSAAPSDAFSHCPSEDPRASVVVFRHPLSPEPVIPIAYLPAAHNLAPLPSYPLGLAWDFPFLVRLKYETSIAGAASAYSFTVPFGIASESESYYGTQLWETGEFPLSETLLQCTLFCDHPTFDSAGVYNVQALFRLSYGEQCYRPRHPAPGDGGFPRDP